jgi:hypothetical protein
MKEVAQENVRDAEMQAAVLRPEARKDVQQPEPVPSRIRGVSFIFLKILVV